MANMKYCMFRNTANDLADCLDELEYADLYKMAEESPDEFCALQRIVKLAHGFIDFEDDVLYFINRMEE